MATLLPRRREQVLHRECGDNLQGEPAPPERPGSSAVPTSSQGTKGSQMRSTSALLMPERSASMIVAAASDDEQHDDAVSPGRRLIAQHATRVTTTAIEAPTSAPR